MLLHATLLGSGDFFRLFAPRSRAVEATLLQARLLPPPDAAALLKNTLNAGQVPAPPPPQPASAPARAAQPGAQRKLAEHLFYPPEAIAQGLQGEVRLLLTLDPDGTVLDAQIASSSGHGLLDRAAADAAFAMRRLPDAGVRELILPVVFKLQ